MKYAFIAQYKKVWPINLMCKVMGVYRNGFYHYMKQQQKFDKVARAILLETVREIAKDSGYRYGSRRMKQALNVMGYSVSRRKSACLMKEAGIQVRYRKKYKVTTNSNHNRPVFDNVLNRQFAVSMPDQAYVSDITYIRTQEGWLYLAVVIDLFSRKVVGWSMSSRMKAALVCDALIMALWQRKPRAGLIVHSDQGAQYASSVYSRLLQDWKCIGSMSRKGNCWDNAVAESFFGSLKQEQVHWCNYQTRYEAQQDILNYITMFYNSHRLHSTLDYMSPNQYESAMAELINVA